MQPKVKPMIRNPILPGFNPDPSICTVDGVHYIATSTFEWYPGVQIHRSRDLVNWDLAARPLNRAALLDMRGNPDSGGIWAPCLSHDGYLFWLVYTDVKRLSGSMKDAHNYITCCETIDGEWSDPWYVNSSGFDPSLFHDDDGRKWFVNMRWNHRGSGTGGNPAHDSFDGILLQEWSPEAGLVGPAEVIWMGTDLGLTEAPHLMKRNGWYYLVVAEGGTGYRHAISIARSRNLKGPYETHPQKHVTHVTDPDHPIQRTGHGRYIETGEDEGYFTFLMGRPIPGPDGKGRFCPLGRETGIEKVVWKDDWPWLEAGGTAPRVHVPAPVDVEPRPDAAVVTDFGGALPSDFQWLRTPHPDRIFRMEPDALVLIGREGIGSWFEQALVARRQEHHVYAAETTMTFEPGTYQEAAGLTTYYNGHKFHALVLTQNAGGPALRIMSCPGDWPDGALTWPGESQPIAKGPVDLRVEVSGAAQQFYWRQGKGDWAAIGPKLDASVISDEGGRGEHASFTGAFVGLFAMDITGQAREARFERFLYAPGGTGG